jgi:hypothetical protein
MSFGFEKMDSQSENAIVSKTALLREIDDSVFEKHIKNSIFDRFYCTFHALALQIRQ